MSSKQVFYIFSRNKKIGSKMISWFSGFITKDLEKVPSHVAALAVDGSGHGLVYESTLSSGVRIIFYTKWLEINEQCYVVPSGKLYHSEGEINSLLEQVWGKPYDWLGILYFAWRGFLLIYFKKDLPNDNRWSSDSKFFCCEFVGTLDDRDFSMTTPAKMCSEMLKDKK